MTCGGIGADDAIGEPATGDELGLYIHQEPRRRMRWYLDSCTGQVALHCHVDRYTVRAVARQSPPALDLPRKEGVALR
jgi:hypothetical protein